MAMLSGLIPFFYYSYLLFYTLLQHTIIFTLHYSHTDGKIANHNFVPVTSVELRGDGEVCGGRVTKEEEEEGGGGEEEDS